MHRDSQQLIDDLVLLSSLEWNKLLASEYNTTIDILDSDITYSYYNLTENIIHFNKNNFKNKINDAVKKSIVNENASENNNIRKIILNSVKRKIEDAVIPLGKNFVGIIICGIEFNNVSFESNCFDNCIFYNCSFIKCDMVELVFTTCRFIGCEIADSNLSDTFFIKSAIFSLNFTNNDHSEQLHLIDCTLFNNQFISNELDNILFSNNLIQNTYFVGNSMKRARFINVIMANSNFDNCILKDSAIKNSNLYNIDFQNNDLRNMLCIASDTTIIKYDSIYESVFEEIDYIKNYKEDDEGLEESYE